MSELFGRWDLTVGTGSASYPSWLELSDEGSSQFVGRWGSARPVTKIEIDGTKLTFSLPKQYESREDDLVFEGSLVDGRLSGETTFDDGAPAAWEGKRAPDLPLRQVAWGEPVDLIGESLDGWSVRWEDLTNYWSIQNGMLDNSARGTDLVTEAKFGDFRLVAEYRYPEGSNSGIYLRGRNEVQILDDYASGQSGVGNSAAIYGFLAPTKNAVQPPGEWNFAEITLVGRFVRIMLNGETVVEGEIPGITGGALDSDEGAPGPILVQGDHGPVTFRRLTLYPAVG